MDTSVLFQATVNSIIGYPRITWGFLNLARSSYVLTTGWSIGISDVYIFASFSLIKEVHYLLVRYVSIMSNFVRTHLFPREPCVYGCGFDTQHFGYLDGRIGTLY